MEWKREEKRRGLTARQYIDRKEGIVERRVDEWVEGRGMEVCLPFS